MPDSTNSKDCMSYLCKNLSTFEVDYYVGSLRLYTRLCEDCLVKLIEASCTHAIKILSIRSTGILCVGKTINNYSVTMAANAARKKAVGKK